ncbi:hypothetical protein Tco_1323607, partial [Tanacetum coccineum]
DDGAAVVRMPAAFGGDDDEVEGEDISRNNIPKIKFNKWEELAGELM